MRTARALMPLLLAAGPAVAQGARTGSKPWRDGFWDVSLSAPGLQRLLQEPEVAQLWRGRADGDVRLELRALEFAEPKSAADARAARRPAWAADARVQGDGRLRAERTRYGAFSELHGWRWVARGFHVFELHAWVRERTPESEGAIRQALDGLSVGPRDEAALLARRIALTFGRAVDDPEVLAEAGIEYATGERYRTLHPMLARRMFRLARPRLGEKDLEPHELWRIWFQGGLAFLDGEPRDPRAAMEWLSEAEATAATLPADQEPVQRRSITAYNLGCAASLAGDLDTAFAALHRAYAESKPVTDTHVSDDKDLENCRRDPRWESFWHTRVKR